MIGKMMMVMLCVVIVGIWVWQKNDNLLSSEAESASGFSIKKMESTVLSESKLASQKTSPLADKTTEGDVKLDMLKGIENLSLDEQVDVVEKWVKTLPASLQSDYEAHKRKVKQDSEKLGYFSEEKIQDYLAYDEDTLITLGDQGNLIALTALARRYLRDERNMQKAKEVSVKAVFWGSANAANSLAIYTKSAYRSGESKQPLYNSLVWNQLASMMGDPFGLGNQKTTLKVEGVSLSEEEWQLVRTRAEALFSQLNEKRNEKGLPQLPL